MNELTLQTFKEKLNIFYYKENEKKETETAVEEFSKFAIAQNKEDNPFFYGELLSLIKHTQIPLSELKNPNSSVVKEIVVQATKKAIDLKEKIEINNQIKTQAESDLQQNDVQKSYEEKLEERRKINETIEKYGGFREFLHQATREEIDRYIDEGIESKKINEEIEALIRAVNDPKSLTEEQKEILKNGELGREFGYNPETGEFGEKERAEIFADQWEAFSKEVISKKMANPDKTNEEILEMLKDDPRFELVYRIGYQKNIIEYMEQEYEEIKENVTKVLVDGKQVSIEQDELETLFDGINEKTLEEYFNKEFAAIEDPALEFVDLGIEENIPEIEEDFAKQVSTDVTEFIAAEPLKEEPEEIQEKPEEPVYQAPIIEEEKKGFAKLIDKLRDSKNPVAKFLFNRISSFQNRDAKKLNETNPVIQPDEYTERPSKGRFGVGDSELMPNGTGIRNSFIRVGEGIMKLFQGNKAEKEPIQTRTPINPNHNPNQNEFDARYAVDLKNNAAANGIIVPSNVKSKKDNANNSREGASNREEGPSFDD